MFDAEIRATFAAQGRRMAEQLNTVAREQYLGACRNWAANGGKSEKPKPAAAVVSEVQFEPIFTLQMLPTSHPVTTIEPEAFLPKYPTDTDAVGGPVGGPIPGAPGRFYATSGANPNAGDVHVAGDDRYVYQRPTPFGGFWVKL